LAKWKVRVVVREFSIQELINSSKENRLLEMFGCATFSPIRPIHRVCYKDTTILLDQQTGGEFGKGLNDHIYEIMSGDDKHTWITPFE
jgi:hypothetical protein